MWPFKKKYLYKVVWAYDSKSNYTYTEYVKASDTANAWAKISKYHISIDCREITKINEEESRYENYFRKS